MPGGIWPKFAKDSHYHAFILGFGPELAAIIEDDSPVDTRWRYFLRYFQGKVNQEDIADYDDEDEGFRSFILMAFHPSVTDSVGGLHLAKQFLLTLDAILEQDSSAGAGVVSDRAVQAQELHPAVESLLPQQSGFLLEFAPLAKAFFSSAVMPARKSPFDDLPRDATAAESKEGEQRRRRTEVLRGWLTTEQTSEMVAMMEEDDVSLHGAVLAAALTATARVLQSGKTAEYPPRTQPDITLRAANEANLRCGEKNIGTLLSTRRIVNSRTTYCILIGSCVIQVLLSELP